MDYLHSVFDVTKKLNSTITVLFVMNAGTIGLKTKIFFMKKNIVMLVEKNI